MIDAVVDTNIVIDLLRNLPAAVEWYSEQKLRLAVTPIVWLEAISGASNKQSRDKTFHLLKRFTTEYMTTADQQWAMDQFGHFYLSHGIGYEDCLIAAVAVRLGVPLYTRNVKHFTPLPALDERQPY